MYILYTHVLYVESEIFRKKLSKTLPPVPIFCKYVGHVISNNMSDRSNTYIPREVCLITNPFLFYCCKISYLEHVSVIFAKCTLRVNFANVNF